MSLDSVLCGLRVRSILVPGAFGTMVQVFALLWHRDGSGQGYNAYVVCSSVTIEDCVVVKMINLFSGV